MAAGDACGEVGGPTRARHCGGAAELGRWWNVTCPAEQCCVDDVHKVCDGCGRAKAARGECLVGLRCACLAACSLIPFLQGCGCWPSPSFKSSQRTCLPSDTTSRILRQHFFRVAATYKKHSKIRDPCLNSHHSASGSGSDAQPTRRTRLPHFSHLTTTYTPRQR